MEINVSSKGQIVIPKEIREKLGIKEGKKVRIEEVEGAVFIIPVPKNPVKALRGISKGIFEKPSTEIIRELRREWKERV